jgi:nitronate monooxygenase
LLSGETYGFQDRPLVPACHRRPDVLVSGPRMAVAACRSGIVGGVPSLNQRTTEGYEQSLDEIEAGLAAGLLSGVAHLAPFMANLNAHKTSLRHDADLAITVKHCVPLVITSLGAVKEVVDAIHEYGGHVFHDVISIRHAEKGLAAGVDRVIAVRRQGRRGQRDRRSVQRAAFRRFPKS